MKKLLCIAVVLLFALSGCANQDNDNKLVVGATAVPHAEILEFIKNDLAKEGIILEIKEFGDYTLVNPALADRQLDANFFQHTPYLDNYVSQSGRKLVEAGKIHIEPMGVYSQKLNDLSELQDGAVVGIPNDAVNEGRALMLLESLGLIELKEGVGLRAMPVDIVENPKNLSFLELDAAMLPRSLSETDISIINTNFILEATDLNPMTDSLAIEGVDSPYANVVAVREADKDNENIKKLVAALQSEKVREFILERYEGAVVPVF